MNKINRKQKIVLWTVFVLLILAVLFPPFENNGRYLGHSFMFGDTPDHFRSRPDGIDPMRWIGQILIVSLIGGGLFVALRSKETTSLRLWVWTKMLLSKPLATKSLFFGILAVVFSRGLIGIASAVVAIVTGSIALYTMKQGGNLKGRTKANWGIGLGISSIIILVVMLSMEVKTRKAVYGLRESNPELFNAYLEKSDYPKDAQSCLDIASRESALGNYSTARTYYQKAIKENRDNARAYLGLGSDYNTLCRYQEAVEACKQAIRIEPDLGVAYNNLGWAYENLGLYQEAVEACKQAIRIEPDLGVAYNHLGHVYHNLGRYQEAVEAYKQAIRLTLSCAYGMFEVGVSMRRGRFHEAIDAYKQVIRTKPGDAGAHCVLGFMYENHGRYQEAKEAYKQAVKIEPDFTQAHIRLGSAYNTLGRYQEAVEACVQAIRIEPDLGEAYNNLGQAYENLGLYQAAIDAYKQEARISPNSWGPHLHLGTAYIKIGDKDSALEEYKIIKTSDEVIAEVLFDLIYE